ncbi:MAG: hypothetical protein U0353_19855 [Sandaracinus sp.]
MLLLSLHLALPVFLASILVGALADRLLGGPLASLVQGPPRGASGLVTRPILLAIVGLSLLLAGLLHPLAALALVALHAMLRRWTRGEGAAPAPIPHADHDVRGGSRLVTLGAAVLAIALRPDTPIYWDEHVWLAKARLGPLALRAAALDPDAPIIPRGYPILGSLAESLFASLQTDLPALTAGAAALVGLALSLVIVLLTPRGRLAWSVAMLTMPLVWVHLRSAQLDLVVGLLALALLRTLDRARTDRRALHASLAIAFVLAGTKDEGLAHVLALAAAHVLTSSEPRARLAEASLVLGGALASFATFHVLLALHGVSNDDHNLSLAGLTQLGAIVLELARAATDVASFGIAWPIVLGLGSLAIARRDASAVTLLLQALLLGAGLVAGTEQLVAFTLDGTVAARLLVQLAPIACWLVACAIVQSLDRGRPSDEREIDVNAPRL